MKIQKGQPKEKEVNEALDKAVIELKGLLPEINFQAKEAGYYYISTNCICLNGQVVGHIPEYVDRAKELGFINGYRYGVEYQTNGKRPNLPDDVLVCIDGEFSAIDGDSVDGWNWNKIKSFRITDQRYKPQDISYLNASSQDKSLTHKSADETISLISTTWWDYENQKALRLPDVGEKVLFDCGETYFVVAHHCNRDDVVIGSEFERSGELKYLAIIKCKPLDHATRKAELEKNKFIQSALDSFSEVKSDYPPASNKWLEKLFGELFDAGFKAPDQK